MALFEVRNLKFSYPESERAALKGVTFSVEEGEFIVVCGKSGCGKTTLLKNLKSVLTPYGKRGGEIFFMGTELSKVSLREQAANIGYVMQSPDNQIVTDKVWHELAFGLENLGYAKETIRLRVAEMASFFGIENWFHKQVEELSGGQKQLLNLASIMAMQPKVLVLDEPTSQLDPIAAEEFLGVIKKINVELGITILMIEHRLEEVLPMADRALVLEDGKVIFYDRPQKIADELSGNELFLAMPSPVRIYEQTGKCGECPLTVCDGRKWLSAHFQRGDTENFVSEVKWKEKETKKKETVIEAKELWFRYERELPDIVKDLSFQVFRGEFFCLLGGNGTGKSTTLSLLSGIKKPYRGKLKIGSKRVSMLPQNPQCLFVKDTVLEDLWEMYSGKSEEEKSRMEESVRRVIDDTEIRHLLFMHPYDLSGGEQQRAALAKVLLSEPEILLLDEPTKGLDGFYKEKLARIFEALKAKGITIVMVSHDVEFCAMYADRCGMFFDGNVAAVRETREFFKGNTFYTTAANRMARHLFPDVITVKEVVEQCRKNRIQA